MKTIEKVNIIVDYRRISMSVQTTKTIGRKEAENKWINGELEKTRKLLQTEVKRYPNELLEDLIEEEFYNYTIKAE